MLAATLWPWYREIWVLDFEFQAEPGYLPRPWCLCALEVRSGRRITLWLDGPSRSPFPTGPDALFVAYFASAEWSCFLELGWDLPTRCVDLYAEFRCATSGLAVPAGRGLLGALIAHGLEVPLSAEDKQEFRGLAIRGGPFTHDERQALLRYCAGDVEATAQLLETMARRIDLPRALLRGRYTQAVARMERQGIPIDAPLLERLRGSWSDLKAHVVRETNRGYGVFVSTDPRSPDGPFSFSETRWGDYLARRGIAWPRLPSGRLALDDDTFREMARSWPREVGPIREARNMLAQLRLHELAVGPDGRNRCLLSPFGAVTGRNAPSNSKFAFGPSAWLRSLIRPGPGRALAYVDWSQQELALAARLSGDVRMQEAYSSSDFYLSFAKMARAVPVDATKRSHPRERELFKITALAVLYGMGEQSLAHRLDVPLHRGRELLALHRRTFARFWEWIEAVENHALLMGQLRTCFGWPLHVGPTTRPTTLRNFLMQAHGAEMMRLAACLATESGLEVCCPVHDAFLIGADADRIEEDTARMQEVMRQASEIVLPGFPLKTDAKVVRYPDRYADERGAGMWHMVTAWLDRQGPEAPEPAPESSGANGSGMA